MMALDEAWNWYVQTRRHLNLFSRLGERHWQALPWDGPLGRDDRLKPLEADDIVEGVRFCLEPLDDLTILVLFSAFESVIRDRVLSMLDREIEGQASHRDRPFLIGILEEARRDGRRERISRLLRFFRAQDAGLVEEVNQVRRYRNWVAHGRRTARPTGLDPALAYRRLKRFLDRFAPPATGAEP